MGKDTRCCTVCRRVYIRSAQPRLGLFLIILPADATLEFKPTGVFCRPTACLGIVVSSTETNKFGISVV